MARPSCRHPADPTRRSGSRSARRADSTAANALKWRNSCGRTRAAARGRRCRRIDAAHGRGPLRRRGADEEADSHGSRCGRLERGGSHCVDVGPSRYRQDADRARCRRRAWTLARTIAARRSPLLSGIVGADPAVATAARTRGQCVPGHGKRSVSAARGRSRGQSSACSGCCVVPRRRRLGDSSRHPPPQVLPLCASARCRRLRTARATQPPDRGLRPTLPAAIQPPRLVGVTAVYPGSLYGPLWSEASRCSNESGSRSSRRPDACRVTTTAVVASTLSLARRHGYRFDEDAFAAERTRIATYLESHRERTLQNVPIAGATGHHQLSPRGSRGHGPPRRQSHGCPGALADCENKRIDGRWPVATLRPPIESSDIEVTAMSMRALQLYAPTCLSRECQPRLLSAHGTGWHRRQEPNTEDRAFRVLGLTWAGASARGGRAPLRVTCSRVSGAMADGRRNRRWRAMPMRRARHSWHFRESGVVAGRRSGDSSWCGIPAAHAVRGWIVVRQITSGADPGVLRKRLSSRRRSMDFGGRPRPGP